MVLSSPTSETAAADSMMISNDKSDIQASKKRKVMSEKMVVTVKIEDNFEGKTSRTELGPPPSDCWSWRKYGQKPIKGSPHPRGYYKCSTSKGCMAKKQVERCRTDSSMLIITYTSTHNHPSPSPSPSPNNVSKEPKHQKSQLSTEPENEDQEQETEEEELEQEQEQEQDQQQPLVSVTSGNAEGTTTTSTENDFHYCQSPIRSSQDIIINISHHDEEIVENHLLLEEEPISYPHLMTLSRSTVFKSSEGEEENDFYDELEELPMSSSSFTSFMRGNFFEERILV